MTVQEKLGLIHGIFKNPGIVCECDNGDNLCTHHKVGVALAVIDTVLDKVLLDIRAEE
jgi:hypothetical protein